MDRLYPEQVDVRTLSPLTLAFVGDGVYSLLVREWLVSAANRPNGALHNMAVHRVRAEADRQVTLVQNRLGLLLFRTIGLDLDRVKEVVARNRRQCI